MEDKDKMVYYRIGDFARKMGVTPDFLKHYEQFGVIRSDVRENGYHYYPFDQSYKILECMRLKSYGFSVRNMESLFKDTMHTVQQKMDKQIDELEQKVAFEQRVIEEHRQFSRWLARMDGKLTDWSIEQGEEMLFLPHSNRRTFLDDPRIYEILKFWIAEMPMVKSCMEIAAPSDSELLHPEIENFFWGMSVPVSYAETYHLPVNGAVKRLPKRKLFQFYFNGIQEGYQRGLPYAAAVQQMQTLGLKPTGDIYVTLLMYANIKNTTERCGYFSIPID